MRVAQALYTNAVKHNNVAAQIWWTKARMGWKDTSNVSVSGNSDPTLLHLLAAQAVSQELRAALDEPRTTIDVVAELATADGETFDILTAPPPTE